MNSLLSVEQNTGWEQAGLVRSTVRLVQGSLILLAVICACSRLGALVPAERYVHTAYVVLSAMWVASLGIFLGRLFRVGVAAIESRTFFQQCTLALRTGDLDQAISIATRSRKTPSAKVVASGLAAYQSAMPLFPDSEVIDAGKRAMRRSGNIVHRELRSGLYVLGSIATTAPLVGAFGTVYGIIDSFVGCGAARSTCMAATAEGLSHALIPMAVSLLVGVLSVWEYRHLSDKADALDREVQTGSVELMNYIPIYLAKSK